MNEFGGGSDQIVNSGLALHYCFLLFVSLSRYVTIFLHLPMPCERFFARMKFI